eukprot:9647035-Alexandrium_andersonii.AAC.1
MGRRGGQRARAAGQGAASVGPGAGGSHDRSEGATHHLRVARPRTTARGDEVAGERGLRGRARR